ncbi:uncharacterized protein HMPREF1541_00382 [Cyphellophora europaea CBS 101466]|uniref:Uncharacterized protein n=1 Tax=Cyphellophora europaea (strain CBS 101466) TaxID=1220924 RepID=W2SDS7_CYPE1|nr:uncharacterized protein HMPREF1541_00382 [Cyphellophora europaea CBS 101466]ETN46198.1 hypothetical protein HMPREF1541_00382 [Cyphellophora europaea CBS 101466]
MVFKVFEAMLGSNFAEGQVPHDTVDTAIQLPEDDSNGMKPMLQLAHWEVKNPDESDAQHLPAILLACDKYDCFETFRYLLTPVWVRWLETYVDKALPDLRMLMEAICMCLSFDDSDRFEDRMELLLTNGSSIDVRRYSARSPLVQIMPADFRDGLIAAQARVLTGSRTWLLEHLGSFAPCLMSHDPPCARIERRLGRIYHSIGNTASPIPTTMHGTIHTYRRL